MRSIISKIDQVDHLKILKHSSGIMSLNLLTMCANQCLQICLSAENYISSATNITGCF